MLYAQMAKELFNWLMKEDCKEIHCMGEEAGSGLFGPPKAKTGYRK